MVSAWKEEVIGRIPSDITQANSFALIDDGPLYQVVDKKGEKGGIYIGSSRLPRGNGYLMGQGMFAQGHPVRSGWIRKIEYNDAGEASFPVAGFVEFAPQGGGYMIEWGDEKYGPFSNVYGHQIHQDKPLFSITGYPGKDSRIRPGEDGTSAIQWGDETFGFFNGVSFAVPTEDTIAFVAKLVTNIEYIPDPSGDWEFDEHRITYDNFIVHGDERITGDEEGPFDDMWHLGYSEGVLTFLASHDGNYFVVCGGKRYAASAKDLNSIWQIRSINGLPVFVEPNDGKYVLCHGTERLRIHDRIFFVDFVDGEPAYVATDDDVKRVIVSDQAYGHFHHIYFVHFAGKVPVYFGKRTFHGDPVVMIGNEEGSTYDEVFSVSMENDLIRFGAVRGHEILLVSRQI